MSSRDKTIASAAAYFYLSASYHYQYMLHLHKYKGSKKPRKTRRCWMLAIHFKRTKESMEKVVHEMMSEPSKEFHNLCRMSLIDFEFLLQKIDPIICKQDTKWRDSIPSKVRLAVTLRYLASGDSFRVLHDIFKISSQVISKIIQEVCTALCRVLRVYVKMPTTEQEWLTVEHGFRSQFPHAVGAIDGKHVVLQAANSSSEELFNIVLLTLIDSNHSFIFADIGCQSRISDGDILKNSTFWNKMENNMLQLPPPTPLKNGNISLPYVFLGDEAFALKETLMKPYTGVCQEDEKTTFNKKLSLARVVVENTFGVMTSIFRVLRKPMLLSAEPATKVVMACVFLHNFLQNSEHSSSIYNPPGTYDSFDGDVLISNGSWRDDIPDHPALHNLSLIPRISPENAVEIRNEFANNFSQC